MPFDPNAPGSTSQADNQGAPLAGAAAVASGARTTSGQGFAQYVGDSRTMSLFVNVTAVSGTTPSMTLEVLWSHDLNNWFNADPIDNFTAITAVSKKVKSFSVKAPYFRIVWGITGTTPSFTFSIDALPND